MGSEQSRPVKKQASSSSRGHREAKSSRSHAAQAGSRREQRQVERAFEADAFAGVDGEAKWLGSSRPQGGRPGAVSRLSYRGDEELLTPPPSFHERQTRREEQEREREATAAFTAARQAQAHREELELEREAATAFADFDSVGSWVANVQSSQSSQRRGNLDGVSRSSRVHHRSKARPGSRRQRMLDEQAAAQASAQAQRAPRYVADPKKKRGSVKSRFHEEFDY